MTSVTDYVLRYDRRFMVKHERDVIRHLTSLYKARGSPPLPNTAEEPSAAIRTRYPGLSSDPAVIADAQKGWHAARQSIVERILKDHPREVYLNCCPSCGSLTRTPLARICLSCGHTWFEIPRDQRL